MFLLQCLRYRHEGRPFHCIVKKKKNRKVSNRVRIKGLGKTMAFLSFKKESFIDAEKTSTRIFIVALFVTEKN